MNRLNSFLSVLTATILLTGSFCHAEEKSGKVMKATNNFHWNFDDIATGKLPAGAEVFTGMWAVSAEHGAPSAPNALCQRGVADYPAIVLGNKVYADLEVSTSFKPISGREDQAAGIIFRVQDRDNYYILRANALEDNVIIFKYVKGRRSSIQEGRINVSKGAWQELGVDVKGALIRGYLNGKLVVEATDNTFKSGKIGLWTKADSQTCFDNVSIAAQSR